MNKSKLLKKSLAMLLTVLMVVAMIPLGASAADNSVTDLQAIYVNGETVYTQNGTFKADITDLSNTTVKVTGLYTDETAELTNADGDPVDVKDTAGDTPLDLENDFVAENGVYTITLTLTSKDKTQSKEYTVVLTKVSAKTTTELATVKADTTVEKVISASISNRTVNVTVPLGYDDTGSLIFTTKDNATIDGGDATDNGNGTYTLANFSDGDQLHVISQSGGNQGLYTVKVTEQAALTSLKVGDVTAKIDNAINSDNDPKITATFPSSVLVKPITEYKCPAQNIKVAFEAFPGTKVEYGTYSGSSFTLVKEMANGKEYDITNYSVDSTYTFRANAALRVTCKKVEMIYPLEFNTEASTANTITAATIDGETAKVNGTKITANLQKNASGNVDVVLTAPGKATIDGFTASTHIDDDGNDTFTKSVDVADLKAGIVAVVTSESGVQKQYEIKVTVTGDVDNTEITSFALRINGATYEGKAGAGRSFTVTVPYLTTDAQLQGATVIATTNAYVKAVTSADGAIASANDLGLTAITLDNRNSTGTATGTIKAKAKSGSAPDTVYNITVKLETAKTGNTLRTLTLSSAKDWKSLTKTNTYDGSIATLADGSKTATVKIAYSEAQKATPLNLKTLATNNGGVAFMGTGTAGSLTLAAVTGQLDSKYITEPPASPFATMAGAGADFDGYIVVLPEKEARKQLNGDPCDQAKGTTYALTISHNEPKTGTTLSSIKVGDTTISSSLSATIPYGMTVNTGTAAAEGNTHFIDKISVSELAALTANSLTFVEGGATNSDGDVQPAGPTNPKLLFERQANNGVKVYSWDGTTQTEITEFVVVAEDGANHHEYGVGTLKYAAANTEAKITSFKLANATGSIVAQGNENWVINVTVPHNTKLSGLIPTFTASAGATVYEGTGKVTSGETALDFTNPVVLKVISEDGGKTVTYTVKATVGEEFSDVQPGTWYYANVKAAEAAGIVSGYPDGTFKPLNSVTRRDFAIMVTKLLKADLDANAKAPFTDVSDNDYGLAAIAYCKENDIINGYTDGTFKPANNITRQEAACIMQKALELSGTPDVPFTDEDSIASWAVDAANACKAAGVFNGTNGAFNPKTNITRAETASVMVNSLNK